MDEKIKYFFATYCIFFIILAAILAVVYVIGYIKSKKNEITVINGTKDYITLFVCVLTLPIILFLFAVFKLNQEIYIFLGLILGLIITVSSIILTFYYSYTANKGNISNILISFLSKLFILLIFAMVFLIRAIELIYAGLDENKNKRYKDGTKGNLIIAAHNRNRKYSHLLVKSLIR